MTLPNAILSVIVATLVILLVPVHMDDGASKVGSRTEKADPFDSATLTAPPPPPSASRRLSSAGRAAALRRKSMSEAGQVPDKLRITVPPPPPAPGSSQTAYSPPPVHPDALTSISAAAAAILTPSRVSESSQEPITPNTTPAVSPKTNRSGRKRHLTPCSSGRGQKWKMSDPKRNGAAADGPEDPFAKLTKMLKGLEKKMDQSEARMTTKIDAKIDGLGERLEGRIMKAETEIAVLSASLDRTRQELELVKARTEDRPDATGQRRPRPLPRAGLAPDLAQSHPLTSTTREDKYWLARRQLRMWPIVGDDLDQSVRVLLKTKLLMQDARVDALSFDVRLVNVPSGAAQNQAIVTFASVADRDGVRAKASNLAGPDRSVGCQLEPPDHLRGQYKAFQSLAYCLKKKTPGLKRNIKFNDLEQTLTMDIKTGDEWKTVEHATAKSILKVRSQGPGALTRDDLKKILNNRDMVDTDDSNDEDDPDITMVFSSENKNEKRSPHSLSFLNTNARSLGPKIQSLADCFDEKHLDMATITETWLQSNLFRDELAREMVDRFSLGLITRERTAMAGNGRQYGGVAFVYRLATSSFSEFKLHNPRGFEVLAAVGKVSGVKGKIFTVSCYAPPNIPASDARDLMEYLSDVVCEAKRTFEDCAILISGDFNQWSIDEILTDHPDLREVPYGPTRGDRSIDRSISNFHRSIVETDVLPPLETEEGQVSDHKMAFGKAIFPTNPTAKIKYSYRKYTDEGAAGFISAVASHDWTPVLSARGVDDKALAFQEALDRYMDVYFPWRTTTKRESDPPWINDTLRKLAAKRRRIYHKQGRSRRWKALKKKSDELYRTRAANYIRTQRDKLTSPDASRAFYKNVRAYKAREKPPEFDVRNLFPGEEDGVVADKLADHFNKISKEFTGINPEQIPQSYSVPLPHLTKEQVEARLIRFKKPKSMVSGDIFPSIVNRAAPWISIPLVDIYNTINADHVWPTEWKTEYVTPIPKVPMPGSPDDLRNISCTKLFSKVYESFVLSWLEEQAGLRPNQYGGVKGVGTEHFLIELWQGVLESLDDSRAAAMLTSIDYSKAFNRLDFSCCLKALQEKGVSQELINVVASFLSGRNMMVKVGNYLSKPRTVEGGVPQGSLLGVLLFNMTIDNFEAFSRDVVPYGPRPVDVLGPVDPAAFPPDAPVLPPAIERDHKHKAPFNESYLIVLKYVDDNIIVERLNYDKLRTDGYGCRVYHATRSQNLFREIVVRAEFCGMKVNGAKTNLMLISDLKSYHPEAFILDNDGTKIEGKQALKVLGFHFSTRPDMSAQVADIRRKFVSRMWVLRHLAHRGFTAEDLKKVYLSVILPCHDYCSVVYHSSLTAQQSDVLERLQSQVLKCIYGYQYSYRELLELTGLTTLKARREARCLKFAQKTVRNVRFANWFPLNENPRTTRVSKPYKESLARTTRLQNSPLYDLRRRLNRASG